MCLFTRRGERILDLLDVRSDVEVWLEQAKAEAIVTASVRGELFRDQLRKRKDLLDRAPQQFEH